jgi:uncharacterized damage-inducible protein DinB
MDVRDVLAELYGRIPPLVVAAVEGLSLDELTHRPGGEANSIAWLTWHLARVEDHHLAELLERDQLWLAWSERFGRAPDPGDTGYGDSAEEVASLRPESPEVLVTYQAAVHERAAGFLETLSADDLDRVVDERWDPPVTMGVRLVSIADDALQHVGQAAYVRGLLER